MLKTLYFLQLSGILPFCKLKHVRQHVSPATIANHRFEGFAYYGQGRAVYRVWVLVKLRDSFPSASFWTPKSDGKHRDHARYARAGSLAAHLRLA